MAALLLHDFHSERGARFSTETPYETVSSYGSVETEYRALTQAAAVIDLSFRSRLCLLGADREKFLHGQVTNDVLRLNVGQGTYGALVTAKGKLEADLFVYKLTDELLLDFEPLITQKITDRLQKYVIAEDVQIVDVAPHYGLLSVQGPKAAELLSAMKFVETLPSLPLSWTKASLPSGELYVVKNGRLGSDGFDLFVPNADLQFVAATLAGSGPFAGVDACEIARIENGIPRFGIDMDETNLAPEVLQEGAISYAKGCYIGQEVIARIRTYGQVAKALRFLRLPEMRSLPRKGAKLFKNTKEVGYVTSCALSPKHGGMVALGYVRKEANSVGEKLQFGAPDGAIAEILSSPK